MRDAKFGIDGDVEDFGGELVGDVAALARGFRSIGEAFLLIHGEWVVNFAADLVGLQVVAQGIALTVEDAHGELVPDVLEAGQGDGKE